MDYSPHRLADSELIEWTTIDCYNDLLGTNLLIQAFSLNTANTINVGLDLLMCFLNRALYLIGENATTLKTRRIVRRVIRYVIYHQNLDIIIEIARNFRVRTCRPNPIKCYKILFGSMVSALSLRSIFSKVFSLLWYYSFNIKQSYQNCTTPTFLFVFA